MRSHPSIVGAILSILVGAIVPSFVGAIALTRVGAIPILVGAIILSQSVRSR
jgi:hypothetical protein